MKQPYLYILFFVLLASTSNGQQKTTTMDSNQQPAQEPVPFVDLQGLDVRLDATGDSTVYLTAVFKSVPVNYHSPIEDFDKVEFSMSYQLQVKSSDGLRLVDRSCIAHFMREDGGRCKVMEVCSSLSWILHPAEPRKQPPPGVSGGVIHKSMPMWVQENDSTPAIPQWRFVGYADDTTLYAVKVLNYLKSLQR